MELSKKNRRGRTTARVKKRHHGQTEAHQRRFQTDLESLVEKISHFGNPFAEESKELFSISTKIMANAEVVAAVTNAKENGRVAYLAFLDKRLKQRT